MTTLPMLSLIYLILITAAFEVIMDTSGSGIDAVLFQDGRPVAYLSKKLRQRMKLTLIYEGKCFQCFQLQKLLRSSVIISWTNIFTFALNRDLIIKKNYW